MSALSLFVMVLVVPGYFLTDVDLEELRTFDSFHHCPIVGNEVESISLSTFFSVSDNNKNVVGGQFHCNLALQSEHFLNALVSSHVSG